FPKTIEEFGFKFNEKGELRNIETDERFNFFERKTSHRYNQKRYEALGELITEYVYDLLEKETNLKRYYIPVNAEDDEPKSFIYMSDDALTNEDKLLLIIHGAGVVRAGQWARKLIINNDLEKGTQLQYIKAGIKQGYGIIVFNTNLNKVTLNGEDIPIRVSPLNMILYDSVPNSVLKANFLTILQENKTSLLSFFQDNETPEDHGIYVWKNFVRNAKAKNVGIVAHSYGGIVTVEMVVAKEFPNEFNSRVFGIGFTDSVHSLTHQLEDDKSLLDFFKQRAVNYVSCNDKLGEPVDSFEVEDCSRISAGTDQHELTSWSCFDLLMKFLAEKYSLYGTNAKPT
ncbi:hypothetical protein LOTGIDRAFT_64460, partial [Lottia gigantea]